VAEEEWAAGEWAEALAAAALAVGADLALREAVLEADLEAVSAAALVAGRL